MKKIDTSEKQKVTRRYLYLSHFISSETPMYANEGGFDRSILKCIEHGDTANTERWSLNNHTGTHIDFPRHFFKNGKTLNDHYPENFIVDKVSFVDLSDLVQPGFTYGPEHFANVFIPEHTEVILLKTGFESYRSQEIYWRENPGYSDTLADYFRNHCPAVRYFGFDSISLTSYTNRTLGKRAHQAFLGGEKPILLIEDMRLKELQQNMDIIKLVIAPLLVDHADGSPVTIIADIAI